MNLKITTTLQKTMMTVIILTTSFHDASVLTTTKENACQLSDLPVCQPVQLPGNEQVVHPKYLESMHLMIAAVLSATKVIKFYMNR